MAPSPRRPTPRFTDHRCIAVAFHDDWHPQRFFQSLCQCHLSPSPQIRCPHGTATPTAEAFRFVPFQPTNSRVNSTIWFTGASEELASTLVLCRRKTLPLRPTSATASFVPPRSTATTWFAPIGFIALSKHMPRNQNSPRQDAYCSRTRQRNYHSKANPQRLRNVSNCPRE